MARETVSYREMIQRWAHLFVPALDTVYRYRMFRLRPFHILVTVAWYRKKGYVHPSAHTPERCRFCSCRFQPVKMP